MVKKPAKVPTLALSLAPKAVTRNSPVSKSVTTARMASLMVEDPNKYKCPVCNIMRPEP